MPTTQAFIVTVSLDPTTGSVDGISELIQEALAEEGIHVVSVNPWSSAAAAQSPMFGSDPQTDPSQVPLVPQPPSPIF